MRTIDADVLIVGSGAGGGVLAGTLSELLPGKRIVIAEKGAWFGPEYFTQYEWDARVMYAEESRRMTADGSMPVKSGECVGGGTTVNVTFCHDPIESVWRSWRDRYGVEGFSFDSEARDYGVAGLNIPAALREVRSRMNIQPSAEAEVNENNRIFERACEVYGITSRRWDRNVRECIGCGFCTEGCSYAAKQGTDQTFIPDAISRGATLIHSFNVTELLLERNGNDVRVAGAVGRVRPQPEGSRPNAVPAGPVRIRARVVILAAGAIGDPILLRRSNVPDPNDLIGRGLILHPALPIIGLMDREINAYRGVSGVSYSDHYKDRGIYLECLFGHPVYGAVVVPGMGDAHYAFMQEYGKLAAFGVMLVDEVDRNNRVEVTPGTSRIHYQLSPAGRERIAFGAEKSVEMMFAGGAREVIVPTTEALGPVVAGRFRSRAEASHARSLQFIPHRTFLSSSHCQATLKMSEDPRLGAIDSRCEVRGVRNLLVCDAASFPTSCGVNPMLAILTLARYQGRRIAAEWDRYAA